MKSLTVSSIVDCIDEALIGVNSDNEYLKGKGLRMQRAATPSEWKSLLDFIVSCDGVDCSAERKDGAAAISFPIPYFFGIGLYSQSLRNIGAHPLLCGVVTMYMAYSTWDGRCLFVDRLEFPPSLDYEEMEKSILRPLAKIAVQLSCARLNWRVSTLTSCLACSMFVCV